MKYRGFFRKRASWIDWGVVKEVKTENAPVVKCSNCGLAFCDIINVHSEIYRYCPYCGAEMWRNNE